MADLAHLKTPHKQGTPSLVQSAGREAYDTDSGQRPSWMDGRCLEGLFTSAARAVDDRNRRHYCDRRRRRSGSWAELH